MGKHDEYSICEDCHKIIIKRKPGSMVWKLNGMLAKDDKGKHEPSIIFDNGYDARKVKKQATKCYWAFTEEQRHAKPYNDVYKDAIYAALKLLGYQVAT